MKNEKSGGAKMAASIGMGVATLAAAAAGAYFLYGKDGAKNRKKIRSWSLKMKADVMDQIEKLKDVTEESYSMVIDQVAEKYSKVKNIDLSELDALKADLKKHWKNIKRDVMGKPAKKK